LDFDLTSYAKSKSPAVGRAWFISDLSLSAVSRVFEGVLPLTDPDGNQIERDLTIPDWVDVPCPQCGVCLTPVNANTVEEIRWPLWVHKCGYSGPVEWINPDPPTAVWAARRLRRSQQEGSRTSG
jgi:hypothetical protein